MGDNAVIAIVKGGLGNQLFIYATARALARRTGRRLYLDTARGFTSDEYGRHYRLDRFPIQATPMPEAWRIAPTLKHPRHKFIRAFNKLLPRNRRTYFAERWKQPASQLTALQPRQDRITLLGYWQDEAYFVDQIECIRRETAPPAPADESTCVLGRELDSRDSVFIHFRRVHYWNLLGLDYYQSAIDAVCARLTEPEFVLFGDDVEGPRAQLDFRGRTVVTAANPNQDELTDLWLMTRCRHAVVANSSFSWWGAWLGDGRSERLVFAPAEPGWGMIMPARWQRLANSIEPGEKPS